MKLDEWNIRKYRRREKVPRIKKCSKITSPTLVSVPPDAKSSSSVSNSSVNRGLSAPTESNGTLTLNFSTAPFNNCSQQLTSAGMALNTLASGLFPFQMPLSIPKTLADDADDLGPIVNSSLMFFSSRPDSKSLQLLAKFPGMAPRAIEILFRNWKPGGEYMRYALRFLEDKDYCQTLMSVNWTRWTHSDETLFDLLDFYVLPTDPENYVLVTKAVLRADLASKNRKLEALSAPWARTWRSAIQATEWKAAKASVFALEVHDILFHCALVVVAEEILKTKRSVLVNWKGDEEPFPEQERKQYMEIVKDCRELQIEVDPELQQNMRILWVP
jgi:hypothetical protein